MEPTDAWVPTISSRNEFASAVLWAAQQAQQSKARQLWWVDTDFADWPLSDPALLTVLTRWLRQPMRRLVLLAASYEQMPRRHARFVAWRRDWVHAIEPFVPPPEMAAGLPCVWVDDGALSIQVIERLHWRARCVVDNRVAGRWREHIGVVLQRSEPGFPANQLGL